MSISVKIKTVYGVEKIYPACPKAQLFADLKGQKTLTPWDIQLIKQLGYAVAVVQDVVAL